MKLATRPRGTGGGPRAARELTQLPTRREYHLLLRAGLFAQDALQRPGEAVKGTGPESVRRRLITQDPT